MNKCKHICRAGEALLSTFSLTAWELSPGALDVTGQRSLWSIPVWGPARVITLAICSSRVQWNGPSVPSVPLCPPLSPLSPSVPLCALAHALGPLAGHSPSLSWELSFLWDSGLRRGGDLGFKCQGRSGGSRQHLLAQGSQQPSLHL